MQIRLLLVCCCMLSTLFVSASSLKPFLNKTELVLKNYVKNGLVDYQRLRDNHIDLHQAVQEMEAVRTQKLDTDQKKVFFINAYNLLVIKSITAHYPITSPLEIEGFFDNILHSIDHKKLTLNEIERRLFASTQDPRIHFALVCAAKGCPKLESYTFKADKIEAQLNEKTKKTLNNTDFINIDHDNHLVELSSIFKWYKHHFPKDIIGFINQYRDAPISTSYMINYYNYDWKINESNPLQNFTLLTNNFLKAYVIDEMVNYKSIKTNAIELDNILTEIENIRFRELTPSQLKAFLINVYNILVIKNIIDHYPITSPLEIEGFFDKKTFNINGRSMTLDEIENRLFYLDKDPLIHFGLVCAAKGCPSLNNQAFSSDNIDEELAKKATAMLDNPAFLIEDRVNNKVGLSFIFKWYQNHFPNDIIQFINEYKSLALSPYATIYYYNYDWKLNDK